MVGAWTNFAKTGNPNSGPEDFWPSMSWTEDRYLEIDTTISMARLPKEYSRKVSFWETVLSPKPPIVKLGACSAPWLMGGFLTTVQGACVTSFQGVPYAAPPTGSHRFLDPLPFPPWEGLREATDLGARCPQEARPYDDPLEMVSEDCLFLNVYSPCDKTDAPLPVMVWFHGGGNRRGSGGTYFYGPEYLLDNRIILVTINYRLIPFGFTSMESSSMPGNQGPKDQVMALRWVSENIASFGGDPDLVTIFGESAGSVDVLSQLVSPLSAGLFSGVIAQSGSPTPLVPNIHQRDGDMRKTILDLAEVLHCSNQDDQLILECLQALDTETIYEAAMALSDARWGQIKDADFSTNPFLPLWPETAMRTGNINKASVVIGFNKDEGIYQMPQYILDPEALPNLNNNWVTLGPQQIFGHCCDFTEEEEAVAASVREFYFGEEDISLATIQGLIDMFTDLKFWSPAHRAVSLLARLPDQAVYEYMFSHRGANSYSDLVGLHNYSLGVSHADELHYLFNPHTVYQFPALEDDDFTVRDLMVEMWTSFATSRNPSSSPHLGFEWTQFQSEEPKYLEINSSPSMQYSENFQQRIAFWDSLFPLELEAVK